VSAPAPFQQASIDRFASFVDRDMVCLFTGIGIGHASIRSRLKGLLNDVTAAFVKEKTRETDDMDQEEDMAPPNNILPEDIDTDELVEDVPVGDEEVDDDDEGWGTESGESSDSEHSMDEDED
jgi:hypothetical protein